MNCALCSFGEKTISPTHRGLLKKTKAQRGDECVEGNEGNEKRKPQRAAPTGEAKVVEDMEKEYDACGVPDVEAVGDASKIAER